MSIVTLKGRSIVTLINTMFIDSQSMRRYAIMGTVDAENLFDTNVEYSGSSHFVRLQERTTVRIDGYQGSSEFLVLPLTSSGERDGDPETMRTGVTVYLLPESTVGVRNLDDLAGVSGGSGGGSGGSGGGDSRIDTVPPVADAKEPWPTWKWVLVGAGVAGLAIGGYYAYKHYKNKR